MVNQSAKITGDISRSNRESCDNAMYNLHKRGDRLTEREEIELLQLIEMDEQEQARASYIRYCEYVHNGQWQPAAHLRYLCERLDAVERGECRRLLVFMPPRHSKSMTVTETFPSYFIGKRPSRRVIEVSYGDSLAQRFGKFNRQKVQEFGKRLFGVTISREKSSMTDWDIEGNRGGMISVGIGGGITGQGADLLLIDDPIKNREEAESETYREKVWDEWKSTLRTRLQPDAAVIIILTRWHEDDLAGRLLNPEYGEVEGWEIISLPALAEDNDPMGRKPGEALWPTQYNEQDLQATRRAVGEQVWAALYQQRPSALEGAMLKRHWWRYYEGNPAEIAKRMEWQLQSWDMTFKDSAGTDYVSGQVWGVNGADIYLLDRINERLDFVATVRAFIAMTRKWPDAVTKLVEDKANGPAVISMLRHKIGGIIAVEPEGSKIARVSAVSPLIEAGNVYLPSPAVCPWVTEFIEQCAAFPNGANDDDVDSMSQALKRFMFATPPPVKRQEEDDDDDDGQIEITMFN